ncbi:hypothetical protein ACOSP7_019774 [Xanthoceras sorbifolium]
MNNPDPFCNFGDNFVANQVVQPNRTNEDIFEFQPTSRFQPSPHLRSNLGELDDIIGFLGHIRDAPISTTSTMQPISDIPDQAELSSEPEKELQLLPSEAVNILEEIILPKCLTNGTQEITEQKKQQNDKSKRLRSNLSERKRRDRINQRMKTLQEMVPNCNKADRARILDNAINYVHFLRLQIETMSPRGVTGFQVPHRIPSGLVGSQVPQFATFLPMRPKFGMGMVGMCYPSGVPMIPAPSTGLYPSFAGGVELSMLSGPANVAGPQMQLSNFVTGFNPVLDLSSEETQSTSEAVAPSIAIDPQQLVPMESCSPVPNVKHE